MHNLTLAQQRWWLWQQRHGPSPINTLTLHLHFVGLLDLAAFAAAWHHLIQQHPCLRTRYPNHAGLPAPEVLSAEVVSLSITESPIFDPAELSAASQIPLDITQEAPCRAQLWRITPTEHHLCLTLHRLIADEWAFDSLLAEWHARYLAHLKQQPPPAPSFQPRPSPFVTSSPTLQLPADHSPPTLPSYRSAHQAFSLPAALGVALAQHAQTHHCATWALLQAAFAFWLQHHTGQTHIVFGTTAPEFITWQQTLAPTDSLQSLLAQTPTPCAAAFPVFFGQKPSLTVPPWAGIAYTPTLLPPAALCADCAWWWEASPHGWELTLTYRTERFIAETIARWWASFQSLLQNLLAHPQRPIAALPLLEPIAHPIPAHIQNQLPTPIQARGQVLYLLNPHLQPVPFGIVGEAYVSGDFEDLDLIHQSPLGSVIASTPIGNPSALAAGHESPPPNASGISPFPISAATEGGRGVRSAGRGREAHVMNSEHHKGAFFGTRQRAKQSGPEDSATLAEHLRPDPFSPHPGARLYRTHILAHAHSAGTLEIIGRNDGLVLVQGHLLNLSHLEQQLLQHPAVQAAQIVLAARDQLHAYLVAQPAANHPAPAQQTATVNEWQDLYNNIYQHTPTTPTFNTTGWNSYYTNQPFPPAEMRAWVENALALIRAQTPHRILDIGCGSGLLLFPLATQCVAYWATDFSAAIIAALRAQTAALPTVQLFAQPAAEFSNLPIATFDTVLLNSVVQYFPDAAYLEQVLAGAVQAAAPGGLVFVGDVRSAPLLPAFYAGIELAQAPAHLPLAAWQAQVQYRQAHERELTLAPAYFHALQQQQPAITHIEVLPKRGRIHNELYQFRYEVLLHIGRPVRRYEPAYVWDWSTEALTLPELRQRLLKHQPTSVRLTHIPNQRVWREVQAVKYLSVDATLTVGAIEQALQSLANSGVTPEDLYELGAELGYAVRVIWPAGDEYLAAVFWRAAHYPVAPDECLTFFPTETPALPLAAYVQAPQPVNVFHALAVELRTHLQSALPPALVPELHFVDTLPRAILSVDGPLPWPPHSQLEGVLANLWAELLGIASVDDLNTDFFALGGQSLQVTQMLARVQALLQVTMPLDAFWAAPTLTNLVDYVLATTYTLNGLLPQPILLALDAPEADPSITWPLTPQQAQLWPLAQSTPNLMALWEVTGPLQLANVISGLEQLIAYQASLLTAFVPTAAAVRQHLSPLPVPPLDVLEGDSVQPLASLHAWLQTQTLHQPLWRVAFLSKSSHQHYLALVASPLIFDEASVEIFAHELRATWAAGPTPKSCQITDVAEWYAQTPAAPSVRYWSRLLHDLPPQPRWPDPPSEPQAFTLPAALTAQLRHTARNTHTTLGMVLLTALAQCASAFTGQTDLLLGVVLHPRPLPETLSLIGNLTEPQPLRLNLAPDTAPTAALAWVRQQVLAVEPHTPVPWAALRAALPTAHPLHAPTPWPLAFTFYPALAPISASAITFTRLPLVPTTAANALSVFETSTALRGYAPANFPLQDWLARLARLVG